MARLYLEDDQNAVAVANAAFYAGPATSILYPSGLIATLGSILMGVAIWRAGTLPRWVGLLFAIHTPLLAFAAAFSYPLELAGELTLLISALWLAPYLWRPVAMNTIPVARAVSAQELTQGLAPRSRRAGPAGTVTHFNGQAVAGQAAQSVGPRRPIEILSAAAHWRYAGRANR